MYLFQIRTVFFFHNYRKLFKEHSLDPFFFTGGQVANLQAHTICSLNIPNNSLYNASYYVCRKIASH